MAPWFDDSKTSRDLGSVAVPQNSSSQSLTAKDPNSPLGQLVEFFSELQQKGKRPLLWVGAGGSYSSGYPSRSSLELLLQKHCVANSAQGHCLIDAYRSQFGDEALLAEVQRYLGVPRSFSGLHESIATLAQAGLFQSIFTTNAEELLEDALRAQGAAFCVTSVSSPNASQERSGISLLRLETAPLGWQRALLHSASRTQQDKARPLYNQALSQCLRHYPWLLVGCSTQDPRLIDWLQSLSEKDRKALCGGRILMRRSGWEKLSQPHKDLLASCQLLPIWVSSYDELAGLFRLLGRVLSPFYRYRLTLRLHPGPKCWRVLGPGPDSSEHKVDNPLLDLQLMRQLRLFQDRAHTPLCSLGTLQKGLHQSALWLGQALTDVLLSPTCKRLLADQLQGVHSGRARLTLQVPSDYALAERALALPWELLMPLDGQYAVREGKLDIVREVLVPGAAELPYSTEPVTVAVSVAVPDDQPGPLSYEQEIWRLDESLGALGKQVLFAQGGKAQQLFQLVKKYRPTVVHLSVQAADHKLIFENEIGFCDPIAVDALMVRMRSAASHKGPHLLLLEACHRAESEAHPMPLVARASPEPEALLVAARLHRQGLTQVLSYVGPAEQDLLRAMEQALYGALAEGLPTLEAVSLARGGLSHSDYPYAWTQLVLYHRGPNLPLGESVHESLGPPLRFGESQPSSAPFVWGSDGFLGRRSLGHQISRKVRTGQTLLVLGGEPGVGKSALAGHLLQSLVGDPLDVLTLRCRRLLPWQSPLDGLWQQVEWHGARLGLSGWTERMAQLHQKGLSPVQGLEQSVQLLRHVRAHLVLYLDGLECLMQADGEGLARFGAEAEPMALLLQRLSEQGLVLVSSRLRWAGLPEEAWVWVPPMGPADLLRLIDTQKHLGNLPLRVRQQLVERLDGRPRTVRLLDHAIGQQKSHWGQAASCSEVWSEVFGPLLSPAQERFGTFGLLQNGWQGLGPVARLQARRLSVLKEPLPASVIAGLGTPALELIQAGLLANHTEIELSQGQALARECWSLDQSVKDFIAEQKPFLAIADCHAWAADMLSSVQDQPQIQAEVVYHALQSDCIQRVFAPLRAYANELCQWGRWGQALEVLGRCAQSAVSGEPLAKILQLQAQIRLQYGDYSVEVAEQLSRAYGLAESPVTQASVLLEQGLLRQALNQWPQAEERLELALQANCQQEAPLLACAALMRLGQVRLHLGRPSEAQPPARQAVELAQALLGPEHPDTAQALCIWAQALAESGSLEARPIAKRALEALSASLGYEHPIGRQMSKLMHLILEGMAQSPQDRGSDSKR